MGPTVLVGLRALCRQSDAEPFLRSGRITEDAHVLSDHVCISREHPRESEADVVWRHEGAPRPCVEHLHTRRGADFRHVDGELLYISEVRELAEVGLERG